jgi:exonuclease I
MSKREPRTDRYKGQVINGDAVSAAPGEVLARIEATQGSERLLNALFRYRARLKREMRL